MNTILTPEAIAIIGIFSGLAAKAFLPYLRKTLLENEPLKWQHRFTAMLIICIIGTVMIFPQFSPPANGLKIFFAAFSFGLAAQWSMTEGYQWVKSYLEMRKEKEPQPTE